MYERPGQSSGVEMGIKTSQIIVLSLIMGVAMFATVVVFLVKSGQMPPGGGMDSKLLLGIAGALLVCGTMAGVFIRSSMAGGLRKRSQAGEQITDGMIAQKFGAATIARAALAEGPALLGVVTTMLTGDWLGHAAAAVGMLILAFVFPTRGKFEAFARDATGRMR